MLYYVYYIYYIYIIVWGDGHIDSTHEGLTAYSVER
jgi:hypothetical protein